MEILKNISGIKPPMFKAYLSRSGWKKQNYARKNIVKYVFEKDESFSLLVPETVETSDYNEAVFKAVRIISQIKGDSTANILRGILAPNQDEIRLQFKGASAGAGSLPLDYLISAAKSIRESIIYSACSEIDPRPFYDRKLTKAIDQAKKVRFGQTDFGSFVMSIEVPLGQPIKNETDLDPFERRVVARLFKGALKAQSVALDNEEFDVGSEYKEGLNANLAESLASLSNEGLGIEVNLSGVWSKALGVPKGLGQGPVLLDQTTFSTLTSMGQTLRGSAITKEVKIEGVISRLNRGDISDDEADDDASVALRYQ